MPPKKPKKRPPSGKRRRKKKPDARKARIRNTLIGGALVMATFIMVGAIALHEIQLEEEERQRALLAAVQKPTPKPLKPLKGSAHGTPAPKGSQAPARLAKLKALKELKLGLAEAKVKALLGTPDQSLGNLRFRYSALGLEVQYRLVGGKPQLESISYSGSDAPAEALAALNLPGLQVGAPPDVLKALLPQGRILYDRTAQKYTLYMPQRHLAIDFTPEAIQAVRMEQGINQQFSAARSGPHAFEVSFDQAFSAQSMFGQRLTDTQFETTVKKVEGSKAPVHTISMRLKVDQFDPEQLREVIKRRVNAQIGAGDVAAAITVLAKNGSKIVDCDWYSPRYTELTGTNPPRFGAVDSIDNISYRWY